jgi:hypothetical protein
MAYPKVITGDVIAGDLRSLLHELTSRLLNGPTPQHAVLKHQLSGALVDHLTLTGAGLYAHFQVSADAATVDPPELIGGNGVIEAEGLDVPAGCLVKVSGGRLDFLEVYTVGDAGWPDEPHIISLSGFEPLPIIAPPPRAETNDLDASR